MAPEAEADVVNTGDPKPFQFFISYAREDKEIADAVNTMIATAMGPSADVFQDAARLPFGISFESEIRKKLDTTAALIIINSDILKPAYAFPSLELGYFIHVCEAAVKRDFDRRIVPICLGKPAEPIKGYEGIDIGISRETLNMTVEEYTTTLKKLDWHHSIVRFLREFQGLVKVYWEKSGQSAIDLTDEQKDLPALAKKMLMAVFNHLKTKEDPESTLKPQIQITLKTNDAALAAVSKDSLPDSACLVGVGPGRPLAIFGIQGNEITWGDFKQRTAQSRFCESWIDAITTVVTSSMQNQPTVDNTQIILSHNATVTYRVILTTGTRRFNGNREFNLYFVEYLRRDEYGDPKTTLLIKGLDLVCRFRSLFLEENSRYSNVGAALATADVGKPHTIKEFASGMERELNLLHRDALEAKLDDPTVWLGLVDPTLLLDSSKAWRPLESRIRDILIKTRRCESADAEKCRNDLIAFLQEVEKVMRPVNSAIIMQMADRLKSACT